jgi:hypothetical protein
MEGTRAKPFSFGFALFEDLRLELLSTVAALESLSHHLIASRLLKRVHKFLPEVLSRSLSCQPFLIIVATTY